MGDSNKHGEGSDFESEDYYDIKEVVKPAVKLVLKLKTGNGNNNSNWIIDSNIREETVVVKNKPKNEWQATPPSLVSPKAEAEPETEKKKKYHKVYVDVNNIIDKNSLLDGPTTPGSRRVSLRAKKATKYTDSLEDEEEFLRLTGQKKRGRPPKSAAADGERKIPRLEGEDLRAEAAEASTDAAPLRKRKPKDPNAPKRAIAPYVFFAKAYRAGHKSELQGLTTSISTKLGEIWRNMDSFEKQPYEIMAQQDLFRFEREMADYVPPSEQMLAEMAEVRPESEDEDDIFREAEIVMDKRFDEHQNEEYLVKWRNYGDDYSTWETLDSLNEQYHYMVDQFERNAALQLLMQQQEFVDVPNLGVDNDEQLESFLTEYQTLGVL
eukprot:TRINITY_DN5862_c0_g1_i1.p1 TRINITY_DN5862_c0_g1~~TRINITY_DN5862_c0_g1_i1.p1  ORF type:complete len:380 (-),score=100.35 TRINITY_DN5862_c0_g1_i1:59-1198(-)